MEERKIAPKKDEDCTYHPKKIGVAYCKSCKAIVCLGCVLSHSRKQHIIVELENIANHTSIQLDNLVFDINTSHQPFKQKLGTIENAVNPIIRVCNNYQEELATERERLEKGRGEVMAFDKKVLSFMESDTHINSINIQDQFKDIEEEESKDMGEYGEEEDPGFERNFHTFVNELDGMINEFESIISHLETEEDNTISQNYPAYPVLYVVNGMELWSFDIRTQARLKQEITGVKKSLCDYDYMPMVQIEGKVYLSGGMNVKTNKESMLMFEIDTDTNHLVLKQNMKYAKSSHLMVPYKGKAIYSIGGLMKDGATDVCEKYTILKDAWELVDDLNEARLNAGVCVLGEYIYIFGGMHETVVTSMERLLVEGNNISTSTPPEWELLDPVLPQGFKWVVACGALPLSTTEILLFGGAVPKGKGFQGVDKCYQYNTDTGEVKEEKDKMGLGDSFYQTSLPLNGFSMFYAVGFTSEDIHMFNVATRKWSLAPGSEWGKVKLDVVQE